MGGTPALRFVCGVTVGLEVDGTDVLAAVRLRFKSSDDFDGCEGPGFGGRGGGGG